jgi:hypothetical protein
VVVSAVPASSGAVVAEAEPATGVAATDWLAAIAAAAIASGAVPVLEAGVGVAVTRTGTGIATAIGVGVRVGTVMPVPSEGAGVVVALLASVVLAAEVSPVDELEAGLVELSFESLDLPRERGGALLLPLALVLALDVRPLLSFWF